MCHKLLDIGWSREGERTDRKSNSMSLYRVVYPNMGVMQSKIILECISMTKPFLEGNLVADKLLVWASSRVFVSVYDIFQS
jgi:hypothetical protein